MTTNNFSDSVRVTPSAAPNRGKAPAVVPLTASAEIASEDEVREHLLELDDDALYRLEVAAARYRRALPKHDVEELVNEALQRALDGRRKWRRDVAFMAFMLETMRSIASEWLKRNLRDVPDSQIGVSSGEDDEGESFLERQSTAEGDPEAAARFRDVADRLERVFGSGDDEVMGVVLGRIEGLSPAETQKEFNMTPKAYAAAQKRLRRAAVAGNLDG